jgi:hypothetical protein
MKNNKTTHTKKRDKKNSEKKGLKNNIAYLATDLLHHSVQEKKKHTDYRYDKAKYITERVKNM